uniref:Ig-like domain-containing protein n=1 Tax=Electrophorus electricus TaxID=8005 RepID=A0AAY5EJ46_ELEEL
MNISYFISLRPDFLQVTLGFPETLILEPGANVTIWCQHNQMEPAYIYWFKHTNRSVPDQLDCQFYQKYSSTSSCNSVNQSDQVVMSVNSQNTSLTIAAVNHTDSGLYYCGVWQSNRISFRNAIHLQVRGGFSVFIVLLINYVFFMLTVVFVGVIVILVSVLLVMLKRRKHRGINNTAVKDDPLTF